MAKRKRLTAPVSETTGRPQNKTVTSPTDSSAGIMPTPRRAPIADVAGQASAVAALEKVAAEMTAARAEGRMVVKIPLDAVAGNYLARDRVALDASEMEVLKSSLRTRGQQTPIEVVQTAADRYGLISGFRRLQALRELEAEGGTSLILAFVRSPSEASDAYIAMVEENEVRIGLSYFERAHVVRSSVKAGVFASEAAALKALFASASRAKRSKIKSFLPVIEHLGASLCFPNALTERVGLRLAARIEADQQFAPRLRDRLRKAGPETAEDEIQLLTKTLDGTVSGKIPAKPKSVEAPAAKQVEIQGDVTIEFKPGELHLTGLGVTQELVDEIRKLLRH